MWQSWATWHADHQQAVVADHRGVVGDQRAVDRHVLANGVVRADHDAAGLFRDVDVLGQPAEDGAFKHVVVGAEGRPLFDGHAAFQDAAWADRHARLRRCKRDRSGHPARFGPWD